MKSIFVLVLSVVCVSCLASRSKIEDRLEEAIRELELEERAESRVPTVENTGILDLVEDVNERKAIKRFMDSFTNDRRHANSEHQQKSYSVANERRTSSSGSSGISYDIDALQRTNTEMLHRSNINNNNNNNNNNGGNGSGRKKRSTSCYAERTCDSSDNKYRSADGSCNNLDNPNWGRAGIPLVRFATNSYDDGISSARSTGVGGEALPLARKISTKIHEDDSAGDFSMEVLTHLIMQWGQFITHDYVSTPTQTDENTNTPTCCAEDLSSSLAKVLTQDDLNADEQCLPILIPAGDRYFTTRTCMSMVRSEQAESLDCSATHKEQLNSISTFIDASNVYGSTDDYMASLRAESEGDLRVNVQPGLMSMHTLFVRQHNVIASYMVENNPSWDSDTIFNETRKISGALMQHITYNEWLPLILGDKISDYDIKPTASGFNTVYDPTVDPRIAAEFSTAAGRYGHSMIQSSMTRSLGDFSEVTDMSDLYGRTAYVTEENGEGFDRIVNGLIHDYPETADSWYSTETTDQLFDAGDENSLDLAALNIQRGRDHGIPSYNDMREFCGLSRATNFNIDEGGFVDHITDTLIDKMAEVYASPDDVDLYTGGISEDRVSRGQIGPLFACLNGKQFEALKKGDRFWYENEYSESGFTLDRLNAIKKVSLSRIICDNTDITTIQQIAFAQPLNNNQEVSCDDETLLPKFDLTPWIE